MIPKSKLSLNTKTKQKNNAFHRGQHSIYQNIIIFFAFILLICPQLDKKFVIKKPAGKGLCYKSSMKKPTNLGHWPFAISIALHHMFTNNYVRVKIRANHIYQSKIGLSKPMFLLSMISNPFKRYGADTQQVLFNGSLVEANKELLKRFDLTGSMFHDSLKQTPDMMVQYDYRCSADINLEDVTLSANVDPTGKVVYGIRLDNTDYSASRLSAISGSNLSLQYIAEDFCKVPHDLVCLSFTGKHENETSLERFGFGRKATPDCMMMMDDKMIIGEVKTTQNDSGLKKKITEAKNQYPEIQDLIYLVVSRNCVMSNLILSQSDVDILCVSFRLGHSLITYAITNGMSNSSLEEAKLREKKLKASILQVKLSKPTLDLHITKDDLHRPDTISQSTARVRIVESFKKALSVVVENESRGNLSDVSKMEAEKYLESRIIRESGPDKHMFKSTSSGVVLRWPLVSPYEHRSAYVSLDEEFDRNTVYGDLWGSIFSVHGSSLNDYTAKPFLDDNKLSDETKEALNKKNRSSQYRISPNVSESVSIALSKKGIDGKKYKDYEDKKQHDANSKLFYPIETSTDHITRFMEDYEDLLTPRDDLEHGVTKTFDDLHATAMNLSLCNKQMDPLNDVKEMLRSPLGSHCSMMSKIFQEINLSLTQNTRTGEFLIKKVEGYPILLLIKPTNSNEKIMVSIYFSDLESNFLVKKTNVFEDLVYIGKEAYCTQFFTLTRAKLSNLLPCSEIFCAIRSAWVDIHRDDNIDSKMTTVMNTLVYLEDKNGTSKALQLARYGYMELLASKSCSSLTTKVLTKLSFGCRSSLECWVVKKYLENFPKMEGKINSEFTEILGEDIDEIQLAQENFPELINVFTGNTIVNFSIALNISYICQFKNKDGMSLVHSNRKILEKIIKEELKLRKVDKSKIGRVENIPFSECANHQYDTELVSYSAKMLREYILRSQGLPLSMGDKFFEQHILHALDNQRFEDISTFKSSATLRPHDSVDSMKEEDFLASYRRRAVEGMLSLKDALIDESTIFTSFHIVHKLFLEDEMCRIIANIFRKAQIGSDREIFILTIKSRIMILYLETISRSVCDLVPWEMLTKGTEKIKRVNSHKMKEMREYYKKKHDHPAILRSYDSNDASTWCQSFVMKMFFDMLVQIVPGFYHESIAEVLNAVTSKELEVPGGLLKEMLKSKGEYFSKPMELLKSQFSGTANENDIIDYHGTRIKNESNMMQGILHYTSSLYHSCLILFDVESFNYAMYMLNKELVFGGEQRDEDQYPVLITTVAVSSDDSSLQKSIILNKKYDLELVGKYRRFLSICSAYVGIICTRFGVTTSKEKSTMDVRSGTVEFNSVWSVRNTLLTPRIKYIYPSLMPATIRGMEDKMHQMANLRSQLLENGFCQKTIAIIQTLQAHQFYCTLGLDVNPSFYRFSEAILQAAHPSVGFFLYEPLQLCGMFGLDFATWLACTQSKDFLRMCLTVSKLSTDVSMSGRPTINWSITLGNDKKYKDFVKKIGLKPAELRSQLPNFSCMLRQSLTLEESIYKISEKVSKPSSAEAFSFQSVSKAYSVSAYVITHKSVLMRDRREESTCEKQSLLEVVNTLVKEESKLKATDNDALTFMDFSFPAADTYYNVMKVLSEVQESSILSEDARGKSHARRLVKITLDKSEFSGLGSLNDALLTIWFGDNRLTQKRSLRIMKKYSALVPWLSRSMVTSLNEGPFDDEASMLSHLSQIASKSRTIAVQLPHGGSNTLEKLIDTIMQVSLIPGKRTALRHKKEDVAIIVSAQSNSREESRVLNNKLTMIASSALGSVDRNNCWLDVLADHQKIIATSPHLAELDAIRKLLNMSYNSCLIELLSSVHDASFKVYTQSQRYDRDERSWKGPGQLVAVVDKTVMVFNINNDVLSSVKTNNLALAKSKSHLFSRLLQSELKELKAPSKNFVSTTHYFDLETKRILNKGHGVASVPIEAYGSLMLPTVLRKDFDFDLVSNNFMLSLDVIPKNKNSPIGKQTIMRHRLKFYSGTETTFKARRVDKHVSRIVEPWLENVSILPAQMLAYCIQSSALPREKVPTEYLGEYNKLRVPYSKATKITQWIKESFNRRLSELGFFVRSSLEHIVTVGKEDMALAEQVEEIDDFDPVNLFDMMDDMDSFMSDLIGISDDEEPEDDYLNVEADEADFAIFSNMQQEYSYISALETCMRSNKFWDVIIDHMCEDETMKTCLTKGLYYEGDNFMFSMMNEFRTVMERKKVVEFVPDFEEIEDEESDDSSNESQYEVVDLDEQIEAMDVAEKIAMIAEVNAGDSSEEEKEEARGEIVSGIWSEISNEIERNKGKAWGDYE